MAIVRDPIKCEHCGQVREFVRPDITIGDLQLHQAFKGVMWKGAPVRLTKQEFDLFELIARRSQNGLGAYKELIYEALFAESEVEPEIMNVLVCKIRRKFRAVDPTFDHIKTLWGRGFRLELPPYREQIDMQLAVRFAVEVLSPDECQEFLLDCTRCDMESIASETCAGWVEFPEWARDNA